MTNLLETDILIYIKYNKKFNLNKIIFWIENGGDININYEDKDLLYNAIITENFILTKYLLSKKININQKYKFNKQSPLILACLMNDKITLELLKYDIDPNEINEFGSPALSNTNSIITY